ncbi:MAG TPA: hypothetical protein VF669_05775 [Tepidisphaeraceae bacterium]|jgi:hypothetical protein
MKSFSLLSFLLAFQLLMVGCASPWQKNFTPNRSLAQKFPPTTSVQLRTVEFERLQNYERREKDMRVHSTTAPEDFTAAERLAAKNRLLEALQLKERGDEIQVIGWSAFADSEQRDLQGKDLEELAEKIGADVVVASSAYAGHVNRVVEYPLTSYSNYYSNDFGRGRRGGRSYSGSESSTVWVPTTVSEPQYYYQAVFLRRINP